MKDARFCVVANVVDGAATGLRVGARVTITDPGWGSGCERVEVSGLSRGGRRIRVWTRTSRLRNPRAAWTPHEDGAFFVSRESAADTVARMERWAWTPTDPVSAPIPAAPLPPR